MVFSVRPRTYQKQSWLNVQEVVQSTEFLRDEFMYKQILEGLESASIMHATAVKQSVKGWLNPPPNYRL